MSDISSLFKALGNKRRIEIIHLIRKRQLISVGEISDHLKISISATSKHLRRLRAVGLIRSRQVSVNAIYSLCPNLSKETQFILRLI